MKIINIESEQKRIQHRYDELANTILKDIGFVGKLNAKFAYYECVKILDKYIEKTNDFDTYTHSVLRQIKEDLFQTISKI